eukprot:g5861.t1
MPKKNTNEDKLQAILLADSYTSTFRPVSLEKPKVLLPVVNVPMIDFTLELLSANGVDEVIVFASSLASQIRDYLQNSSLWATEGRDENAPPPLHSRPYVRIIADTTSMSAGDALREIDRRGVITSDPFVLISGDVVSNIDLRSVVNEHKSRKKKDSSAIMTMVMKTAAPAHPTREIADDLVVIMDVDNNQILGFENDDTSPTVTLLRDSHREHSRIAVRHDLLDCNIDVLSPEVLLQFSENYDYQNVRNDYIHNEVVNIELGWKYFAHITNSFAARIQDLRSYDNISRDIVSRWTFPIMPDSSFGLGASYSYHRCATGGGYYREQGVKLARGAKISAGTVLGAGCSIADGAVVERCVIGRGCVIGPNVVLRGSYFWRGCVVESSATVLQSVICNNARICKGAVVQPGCVVSFGVKVEEKSTLAPFSRITRMKVVDDGFGDFDDDKDKGDDSVSTKLDVTGRLYTVEEWDYDVEEDSEDENEDSEMDRKAAALRGTFMASVDCERKRGERWIEFDEKVLQQIGFDTIDLNKKNGSRNEQSSGDGSDMINDVDEEARWLAGVRDYILHGLEEKHSLAEIAMEIGCYKHSEFKQFTDCVTAIVPVVLDQVNREGLGKMQLLKAMKSTLQKFAPLFEKFQLNEEGESLEDLVHIGAIYALEEYVLQESNEKDLVPVFGFLLQFLWESDITTSEAILEWSSQRKEDGDDVPESILYNNPRTQKFIEDMDDESDSEEEETDSESESE